MLVFTTEYFDILRRVQRWSRKHLLSPPHHHHHDHPPPPLPPHIIITRVKCWSRKQLEADDELETERRKFNACARLGLMRFHLETSESFRGKTKV